jgi:Tfp pilus assembly protein PilE
MTQQQRTATPNPRQPKRVKIDPLVKIAQDSSSPLGQALNVVSSHCASLHPELASILNRAAKNYLHAMGFAYNKSQSRIKLEEDEDRIPKSVKSAFELTASKAAKDDPEFTTISTEFANILKQFQDESKKAIIKVMKVEERLAQDDALKKFSLALDAIVQAFLKASKDNTTNKHKIVNTILDRHHEDLLKPFGKTLEDFRQIYQSATSSGDLPAPYQPVAPVANNGPFGAAAQQAPPPVHEQEITKIFATLDAILSRAWDRYVQTTDRNSVKADLKRLEVELFTEDKTTDAQMALDNEAPTDRPTIQRLITEEVKAALAKASPNNNRNSNRKSSPQKNNQRGQSGSKSSRSRNKKTPRGNQRRNQQDNRRGTQRRNDRDQADDANNDMPPARPNNTGRQSQQRSTPRNASRTRGNDRSRRQQRRN